MGFWLEWALNSLPRGFPIVRVTRRELFCFVCRARMWIEPEKKMWDKTHLFFFVILSSWHTFSLLKQVSCSIPKSKENVSCKCIHSRRWGHWRHFKPCLWCISQTTTCLDVCSFLFTQTMPVCFHSGVVICWTLTFPDFFYFTSDFCPLTSIHTTVLWFLALNHCSFLLKNIWWFPISWLKTSIKNVYILE